MPTCLLLLHHGLQGLSVGRPSEATQHQLCNPRTHARTHAHPYFAAVLACCGRGNHLLSRPHTLLGAASIKHLPTCLLVLYQGLQTLTVGRPKEATQRLLGKLHA
jgi:hypothetical protein